MAAAINQSIDNTQQAFDQIEEKVFYYESILDAIPHPISVTDNDMRLDLRQPGGGGNGSGASRGDPRAALQRLGR